MKKLLVMMLIVLMAVGMAACADSNASDPNGNNNDQKVKDKVTIEEQLLLDRDGIVITAGGLGESWLGPEVNLHIENNSQQPVTIQARKTSVNGYMISPTFSCDVAPGKKANDSITFTKGDLEECGVEVITDIELVFHVFNTDSWENIFDSEPVVIETSASATYTQEYDASGTVVFDDAGIKIIYKGMAEGFLGPQVVFYIENNSEENITVQTRNTSVNGYMVESIFSCDMVRGKRAVDTMTLSESELDKNNIEEITEIELNFHIFNLESWDNILDTETITINTQ